MSRVIVKNLPKDVKEPSLREHFSAIGTVTECSLRYADNVFRRFAFIGFKEEDAGKSAVKELNQSFIGISKIEVEVARDIKLMLESPAGNKKKSQKNAKKTKSKSNSSSKVNSAEALSEELILETGRLCLRNLPFCCEAEDLENLFSSYGKNEVHLVIDRLTKNKTGMGYVNFEIPEEAMKAYKELDRTIFMGRQLHILPGKAKKEQIDETAFFKKKDEKKNKTPKPRTWNTLFVDVDAAAEITAQRFQMSKRDLILNAGKDSVPARLALGQSQIALEIRDFLLANGVALDSLSQADGPRSKTVILVKHRIAGTTEDSLRKIFERFGTVTKLVQPPCGLSALVEFAEPSEAKYAFEKLDMTVVDHKPLFLEWAPMNIYSKPQPSKEVDGEKQDAENDPTESSADGKKSKEEEKKKSNKFIIKNVAFEAKPKDLEQLFSVDQGLKSVRLPKKVGGTGKHRGFGFVEFLTPEQAEAAFNELCHNTRLYGRRLVFEWASDEPMGKRKAEHYEESSKRFKKSEFMADLGKIVPDDN